MDKRILIAMKISVLEASGHKHPHMSLIKKETALTMPTVSNSLKRLVSDEIIERKVDGRKVYYNLTSKGKKWVSTLGEADKVYQVFGGKTNEKVKIK